MTDYISSMPVLVFEKIFESFSIKELAKMQEVSPAFYDAIEHIRREKCYSVGFKDDQFNVTYEEDVIQTDKDIWSANFQGLNQLKWYKPEHFWCGYSSFSKPMEISRRFLATVKKFTYEAVNKTDLLDLCETLPMLPAIHTLNIDSYEYTEDEFSQIMDAIRIGKTNRFELEISMTMPLTAKMVDKYLTITKSLEVRNITLTSWGYEKLNAKSLEGIMHFFESTNLRQRNSEDEFCSGTITIEKMEYDEAIEVISLLYGKRPKSAIKNTASELSFTKFDDMYGHRKIRFVKCRNSPFVENLNV